MAVYTLEPDENTLHGFFSSDLAPVLTIESGDTVRMRTLDAEWALEPCTTFTPGGPPPGPRATTRVQGPKGHALCGPIAIRGARPGMTLAIRVDAIRPGSWGWSWGGGELVDAERAYARNQHGHRVGLPPFLDVMGMPPAEAGQHSTRPRGSPAATLTARSLSPAVRCIFRSRCPASSFRLAMVTQFKATARSATRDRVPDGRGRANLPAAS
jgi:acetamidase/formamidase